MGEERHHVNHLKHPYLSKYIAYLSTLLSPFHEQTLDAKKRDIRGMY